MYIITQKCGFIVANTIRFGKSYAETISPSPIKLKETLDILAWPIQKRKSEHTASQNIIPSPLAPQQTVVAVGTVVVEIAAVVERIVVAGTEAAGTGAAGIAVVQVVCKDDCKGTP